jgi:hypothetical protein
MDLREIGCEVVGMDALINFCEHGKELLDSIKSIKFPG